MQHATLQNGAKATMGTTLCGLQSGPRRDKDAQSPQVTLTEFSRNSQDLPLWTQLGSRLPWTPLSPPHTQSGSIPMGGQEKSLAVTHGPLTKMRQVITRDNHQLARLGVPDELVS